MTILGQANCTELYTCVALTRLLDLSSEAAAFCQAGFTSCWLAENCGTRGAEDDSGGVRENSGDLEASRALHIHEEAVGRLYEALELVLLGLVLSRRIQ